jgi:hypothetical protein
MSVGAIQLPNLVETVPPVTAMDPEIPRTGLVPFEEVMTPVTVTLNPPAFGMPFPPLIRTCVDPFEPPFPTGGGTPATCAVAGPVQSALRAISNEGVPADGRGTDGAPGT